MSRSKKLKPAIISTSTSQNRTESFYTNKEIKRVVKAIISFGSTPKESQKAIRVMSKRSNV